MKIKPLHIIAIVLVVLILVPLISGMFSKDGEESTITSIDQFTTEKVGVQAGTLYEEGLLEQCPDVEIVLYTAPTDMLLALEQGKIDALLVEDLSYAIREDDAFSWLKLIEGTADSTPVGVGVSDRSKYPLLKTQFDEFISRNAENGVSEELSQYWLYNFDPDASVVDRSGITGENGKIAVAVENAFEPFSYYGLGDLQGYDIDLVYRFCREYGYEPEFYSVEYDAIPVGISTGKFDIGMSVIISEERTENMTITSPYFTMEIKAAVKGDMDEKKGFFESIGKKFEQTFIKENRWLLFLEGAGTTLVITCLSVLFGILMGLILYMLCRKSRAIDKVNGFINWLISGMPTVLLLMILYYLIFVDWADIGGLWVAVIGFTILFGYTIFDILTTSVSAIGKGQEEGARALGYTSNQTFFQVIMPQALRVAFPQLKGAIVDLIKETSIVGYISIADLTRMSDIVRSRTYESFFPLITSTVIYFALIGIILFVVKRIEFRITFRPLRIAKIKKGINTK